MAATIQISTITASAPQTHQRAHPTSLVYWRRRIGVGVLLVLLGAALWTVATWAANSSLGVDPVTARSVAQIYVVQPGDTLWSVASQIGPDGDVRSTVDRLADLNGGSAITAGQRLLIESRAIGM